MKANLIPVGQHAGEGHTPVAQFFVNVRILADANNQQAAILFGMLFTFVIWVFSAFGLILACLFYVIFLWHHIPSLDGSLARYCRRKVDKRLAQIVGVKITKAIERENKQSLKGDSKSNSLLKHQPTLPILDDDKSLSRQTSQSTFPQHGPQSSVGSVNRFDERRSNALPGLNRPAPPPRLTSQSSAHSMDSYTSDAPLMSAASAMGYSVPRREYTPAPPSRMGSDRSFPISKPSLSRLVTQDSQRSHEACWTTPTSEAQYIESPFEYSVNPSRPKFSGPGRLASGAARSETPASLASRPQGRKPLPHNKLQEKDSYEMEVHGTRSATISPASTGYTAFKPSLSTFSKTYDTQPHSLRSATAPPQQQYADPYRSGRVGANTARGHDWSSQNGSRYNNSIPLRSGTAPIGASSKGAWAGQKGMP